MRVALRMIAMMMVLAAGDWHAAGVSAVGSVSSCAGPPASNEGATSPAGNGWAYLYQGADLARLWRWTGVHWVSAANASSPAVVSPALAPEPISTGLILIGVTGVGQDHRVHPGMWRWRNGHWSRLRPSVLPAAGFFQAKLSIAQDRVHHTLLLSETISNAAYAVHNELWLWDGTTWRRVASDQPGQITGSTVPNPIATGPGGAVYGFQGTTFNVTHLVRWNGAVLEPVNVASGPRAVAALGWDPASGALLALGGARSPVPDTPFPTSVTYRFDGSHWTSAPLPSDLQNWVQMLLVADQKHSDVLLWGGQRSYGFVRTHPVPPAFPATWRWRGGQWTRILSSCRMRG